MCKLKKTFQIYNQNSLYWAYFQTKKSKHTCITSLHTNGVNGPLATTEKKKKKKKKEEEVINGPSTKPNITLT